jgi:hypothetical protein
VAFDVFEFGDPVHTGAADDGEREVGVVHAHSRA